MCRYDYLCSNKCRCTPRRRSRLLNAVKYYSREVLKSKGNVNATDPDPDCVLWGKLNSSSLSCTRTTPLSGIDAAETKYKSLSDLMTNGPPRPDSECVCGRAVKSSLSRPSLNRTPATIANSRLPCLLDSQTLGRHRSVIFWSTRVNRGWVCVPCISL